VKGRPAPGSILELTAEAMALDGDAVARAGTYVLLVPGAIPGERIEVEVVSAGRKSGKAALRRVLAPSPHRVAPFCRHFGPCGGCAWQHIAYEEQLRLKRDMLASTLARALGSEVKVLPTVGLPSGDIPSPAGPRGYRHKAHFTFGSGPGGRGLIMGHYRRGSRDLLPVEECPVHAPAGNRIAFAARDLLRRKGVPGADEDTLEGLARHIVVRTSAATGVTQAVIVAVREDPRLRGAAEELGALEDAPRGIHLEIHDRPGPFIRGSRTAKLAGEDRLIEEVAGARFSLSERSFFQTSVRSAERLAAAVLGRVPEGPGRVLDLYAGAGLFSIPLALRGARVLAVEENPSAVADGRASLDLNPGIRGECRFERRRVEDFLRDHDPGPEPAGTVILDPPREGCPPGVLEALASLGAARAIYVSCNPRALARDIAVLAKRGCAVIEVEPVDMFPHTAHIEAVALVSMPERRPPSARRRAAKRRRR